mgnify:CR=1 FL=1
MHGVGKGRKAGARNKTTVERIIDMVVVASGGSHHDTLSILEEHYNVEQNRLKRGQNPVRVEFANGNKFSDRYLNSVGMNDKKIKSAMKNLVKLSKNPKTVSVIDS